MRSRDLFFFLDNMQQRSSTNFDGQPHCWVSAVIPSERAKYKPEAELNYKAEEIFTMLNRVKAPGEKYLKSSYMIIKTKTHTHETSKVLDWGDTGNWQENSLF